MTSLPLRLVLLVSMATLIRSSSWLHFAGNSETIRELIQPLKLTCTFQISKNDSDNDSQVLFMSIYHETKRVIASISKYQPVATSLYPSVTQVQGHIYHSNESEDSYLQVILTHPKLSESGKYFCLAHARNSTSQNYVFDADITINVTKSSADDLAVALSYIQDRLDKDFEDHFLPENEFKRKISETLTHALREIFPKTSLELFKKAYFVESTKFSGSTYLLSKDSLFFYPSFGQAMCGLVGGYLVEVNTIQELDFIKNFLSEKASRFRIVMAGGTDEDHEGLWVNGHSLTEVDSLWSAGQPDDSQGQQDCQVFYKPYNWNLDDNLCVFNSSEVGFLCEVKV